MARYTWNRDTKAHTCTNIECDSAQSANAIRDHLVANGIGCQVRGTTVQFDGSPLFMEVIRASEPFVGVRLMSENV
jgi:hypothetical protein